MESESAMHKKRESRLNEEKKTNKSKENKELSLHPSCIHKQQRETNRKSPSFLVSTPFRSDNKVDRRHTQCASQEHLKGRKSERKKLVCWPWLGQCFLARLAGSAQLFGQNGLVIFFYSFCATVAITRTNLVLTAIPFCFKNTNHRFELPPPNLTADVPEYLFLSSIRVAKAYPCRLPERPFRDPQSPSLRVSSQELDRSV